MILNIDKNKISQFVYLLLNDYNYIVDDIFEKIIKIYQHEQYIKVLNWRTINSYSKVIKIYSNFVECMHDILLQIARNMPNILIEYNVLEKLINIINFYINKIVGDEKENLNVRNPIYYKFIKNDYLKVYAEIITYIFGQTLSKDIINYMHNDKRSYKRENYENIIDILKYEPNFNSKSSIITLLLNKIDDYSDLDDYDDIPDDLCDPLLSILIEQPVELPSTDIIVDRRSISKHLLSSNTKPELLP